MGIPCIQTVKEQLYSCTPFEVEQFHSHWILLDLEPSIPPCDSDVPVDTRQQLSREFVSETAQITEVQLMRLREVLREQQATIVQQLNETLLVQSSDIVGARRARRRPRCGICFQKGHNCITCSNR
ncbi:hypothetical protein P9112_008811 [Eukaryota sp. TZLM1-RC]